MQKVRAEAERLEVMDKAAGILAELLYTEKLLTQIKEYRSIMLHVSEQPLVFAWYKLMINLCCSDGYTDTDMSFTLLVPLLYLVYLHMPHTHTHTHIHTHPQLVLDNRKGQKYLLGAFEILVGEVHPELLSRVPHILKAFYDNDILEEEAILEWADRVSEGVMRGVFVCGGGVGGVGGQDRCLSGCTS